jgi:hypothetical protein
VEYFQTFSLHSMTDSSVAEEETLNSNETTLAILNGWIRIRSIEITGFGCRAERSANATMRTTAPTTHPMTRGEVQPHSGALMRLRRSR